MNDAALSAKCQSRRPHRRKTPDFRQRAKYQKSGMKLPSTCYLQQMKSILAYLAILYLTGCAHQAMSLEQARAQERLPTSDEVSAYVRTKWDQDYGVRFARFASRPSERPMLVSLSDVSCEYYVATPECSFDVEARFSDDTTERRRMVDQYGWGSQGELEAVIVMYHERKR